MNEYMISESIYVFTMKYDVHSSKILKKRGMKSLFKNYLIPEVRSYIIASAASK